MIYLITAILIITLYISIITIKYGIQKSISFSDVVAEKPYKWFFEITMYVCGIMLFIYAKYMIFLKIGSVLIFMIGLFPLGQTPKWVRKPHFIIAVSAFIFCLLSIYLDLNKIYPLLIIVLSSITGYFVFKNKIWAIEIIIIYGTLLTLLIT